MRKFRRWFYSIWYNHPFKIGYKYQMIRHTNLDLLEKHHYIMINDGWEQDGDVKANFTHAYCWYRQKSI